ncbi:serpin B10-like [Limulus polyphemus]|uniref:Serpin B10-like n=1 Tax=Limulus polyphemus TaxID=6850 RepID=A0ABM1BLR8_LIMPO|nr:serpin B10-like [Limulus polyphemus]XP_013784562.1 serpin B10-like [Limulus polyphemus]XP_013784563.1 serpin B10-like [Limulus polyphemus]XP_013784564.1 serpin B10-like [Limulus polyphemus]XP_013784565.1 serpin B10-like [Limulus polyphemus]XP_022252744.1 serpin B10-like [Limulus polyphemus]
MAYLGAAGVTAREMENALGYRASGIEGESVHKGFKTEQSRLNSIQEKYELSSINAALIQNGYTISQSYIDGLEQYYKSAIKEVNFTDSVSVLEWANAWGYWASHSKINNLLSEKLPETTKMILLNGVYFKGKWLKPFDPKNTREEVFTNENGQEVVIPVMHGTFNTPYAEYAHLSTYAISFPYVDEDMSMIVLLPSEISDLKSLEKGLTTAILDDILSQMETQVVKVGLPKFELNDNRNLKKSLKSLGMESTFTEINADFSGITGNRDLYLEEVLHQAVIQVNEEGTTAAANTVIQLDNRRKSLELIINRPFLFLIRDNRSGLILFLGRVAQLK